MTDNNYQAILDLIKNISGQKNIISLPRIFLKVAGDVVVGLFLSQCVWYSDKGGSHDGWFFKSNKDWQDEIGLSYAQVKRATAKLEEMGVLQTKLKKAKGAPTTHYYIDMDALTKLILDFLEIRQNGGVENQESSKSKDFQETEKTITALTPTSTETTLGGKTPTRDYLTDVFNGNVNLREGEKLIQQAEWDINDSKHRQAMAAFLEASRLPIPRTKTTRGNWLSCVGDHIHICGASELEELYPRIIAHMRGDGLTVSRPGSVTNNLADWWARGGKPNGKDRPNASKNRVQSDTLTEAQRKQLRANL